LKKNSKFSSRTHSIRIALEGLITLLVLEPNARIHALFTVGVIAAGWLSDLKVIEWVVLTLTVGFVWMAEAFNTAVEKMLDLFHPEMDPEVKAIKDLSAGAVLISALTAVVVGLLIFGPRLWTFVTAIFLN
jgi:diacylglycerol kinase (ATP)